MTIVVGSGVSKSTTARAPMWRDLIEAGLNQCRALGAAEDWCDLVLAQLKMENSPDMLLSAAELVHQALLKHGMGEFGRWLRDSFEDLQPENSALIENLAALDAPLITTNYDDLIEKITGRKHVTWRDSRNVSRVVRGEDQRILHLHGHWEEPESVVLGIRSYEAVKNSEHTQAVLKALGMTKSFLFVGCGEEGLADPNWGNFLSWLDAIENVAGVEHRHYMLVREKDVTPPEGRIFKLSYGEAYADLPEFLKRLRPKPEKRKKTPSGKTSKK